MERCLNWMVREGLLEKMEFEQRSEGSNERTIYFMCAKIFQAKGGNTVSLQGRNVPVVFEEQQVGGFVCGGL